MVQKEIQNECKHKDEHFINLLSRHWGQKFKFEECHAVLQIFSE